MEFKSLFIFIILSVTELTFCHASFPGLKQNQGTLSIFRLPPFERAVRCIKFYEGWHTKKDFPYIGYGHRIQPNEKIEYPITEKQADSLLRSDLLYLCSLFRFYKKDAVLLATLAYNIGPYKLLGNSKYPKSMLLNMLENGERNVYKVYTSYCHWNGRKIASIRRRRILEFKLLYVP